LRREVGAAGGHRVSLGHGGMHVFVDVRQELINLGAVVAAHGGVEAAMGVGQDGQDVRGIIRRHGRNRRIPRPPRPNPS